MRIDFPQPRRILLVKPSALGDVVHGLPVASLLKRRWPDARLDWLVSRPFAPLVETCPAVDETVVFDRNRGAPVRVQRAADADLGRRLRDGRYDLVVDLQGLFRSAWFARRTNAPVRVGFARPREWATWGYTHRVPEKPGFRHAIERNLDVAEVLGCGRSPVEFRVETTPADGAAADNLLKPLENRPFALLMPGTNWPTKRWPASSFAGLARKLREKHDLSIVLAGADDAASARPAFSGVDHLDAVGRTSVRELAALLRRAAIAVTNDSGPMHLAAALGTPVVAAFGPTDPRRTGPFGSAMTDVVRAGLPCLGCLSRSCAHTSCMHLLPYEALLQRCDALLSAGRGGG